MEIDHGSHFCIGLAFLILLGVGAYCYLNYPEYTKTIAVRDFIPAGWGTLKIIDQDNVQYYMSTGLIMSWDIRKTNIITYHVDPLSGDKVITHIEATFNEYNCAFAGVVC